MNAHSRRTGGEVEGWSHGAVAGWLFSITPFLHHSNPLRRIPALRLGLAALCAALLTGSAFAELPAHVTGQIQSEEQRQLEANQNLGALTQKLDNIIEDLRSNSLFQELGGGKLEALNATLSNVNKTHVLGAIEQLRKAVEAPRPEPHLELAAREIDATVTGLSKLIERSLGSLNLDVLLAELRAIIQKQEQEKMQTSEWGKQLLQGIPVDDSQHKQLAFVQQQIGGRILGFQEQLLIAGAGEGDPQIKPRITAATSWLAEKNLPAVTDAAARVIKDQQPVASVELQDQTLALLREAERLLEGQEKPPTDDPETLKKLEDILQNLQALHSAVESASPAEFAQQLGNFQVQNSEVQNALAAMNKPPLAEAVAALSQAQGALAEMQQAPAAAAQAQAAAEVQTALDAARDAAAKTAANKAAPAPGTAPPDPAAAAAAAAGQAAAVAAGTTAGMGMVPGAGLSPASSMATGAGIGLNMGIAAGLAAAPTTSVPATAPGRSADPRDDPRLFSSSTQIEGARPAPGASKISPFGAREQQALKQNYEGELPAEYRGLLEDYFEVLSK